MDITQLSNLLLEIFYIMIGLFMGITMVFTLKDKQHKTSPEFSINEKIDNPLSSANRSHSLISSAK